MYPGDDVIVNPSAIPGSPGYGQSYKVHKPHHHRRIVKPQTVASDTVTATPAEMTTTPASSPDSASAPAAPAAEMAPTPPPPAKKHSKHMATAAAAPAGEAQSGAGMGFTFGDDEPPAPPPAANTRTASNETPPPATQAAKPAKPDASTAGLAKRGSILFEHASTDPQPTQMDGIKLLAGDLNSALEAGATQIQLMAFGGAPGDKGSDAKRISLKRALAIRQLLIDNGVPSNKIITKAMGGATDGEADRVDIYVRA
jgi:outer membrane protein OmpA-like peptidoglycan-associated protein